jgi:hypothetical protein
MMTNHSHPFVYGRPVRPNEFFNREASMRTVFNRMRNDESTAVVGEPHIGKSSVLLKLEDKRTQKDHLGSDVVDLTVSHIDLHPVSNQYTPVQFWEEALEELEDAPGDENIARLLTQIKPDYRRRSLERLFNYMGQGGRKLVLLLDEFERLLHHPNFKEDPAFFALLRSLATRTGGLVLVPASRLSVAEMNDRSRGLLETGSPFFNNIIEEKLDPFDVVTLEALLDQAGEALSLEDRRLVEQVVGRHPFLVQAMAASLVEEPVGPQRYTNAIARFYERVSFHFDDMWYTLDDRTRSTAVILSLLGLGGQTLGWDFASDEVDRIDDFGPELRRLAAIGLARPIAPAESAGWQSPVSWRGERWTIGAQAFAWWVREVLLTGTRQLSMVDDWLAQERYHMLLSPDQWEWLLETVRAVTKKHPTVQNRGEATLAQLRQILIDRFDEAELRDLCFDLNIDFQILPGTAKNEKARELIVHCERRGRTAELWQRCRELRPHLFEQDS